MGVSQLVSIHGRKFGLSKRNNLVMDGEAVATIKSKAFSLTSAQILALNGTPITLVPAPGAGRALVHFGTMLFLDYNSTAYDGVATGEDIAIRYTDGSGAIAATAEMTGWITLTADALLWVAGGAAPAATGGGVVAVANAPLVAHMTTGNIATGNSPVYGRIYYMDLPSVFPSVEA